MDRDESRRYANNPLLTLKFQPRAVSPTEGYCGRPGIGLSEAFSFLRRCFDALTFDTFKRRRSQSDTGAIDTPFYTDGKP
jgi:hypothetical protein